MAGTVAKEQKMTKHFGATLSALALAVVVSGCAGGSGTTTTAAASPAPTTSAAGTAAPATARVQRPGVGR